MNLKSWLHAITQLAPIILAVTPGVPTVLIPAIIKGIQAAETIPGASGPDKLTAALKIVDASADAINAAKPNTIRPAEVTKAVTSGIATVIAVTNIKVKQPPNP